MLQVKDITKLEVDDLWREIKWDQEGWCGDIKLETMPVVND